MEKTGLTGIRSPLLRSENLRLRAVEPSDIEFLFELENDPNVWCVGNTIAPFSKYQIEQYVYSTGHDIYAEHQLRLMVDLLENESRRCVAVVDLFDFDPHHRRAGIGILVIASEREKGYASEVISIIKKYAHEVLQLHQLYCSVLSDNPASIHLFEKSGFVRTGVRKDWRFQKNRWVDEIVYQFIF